jgi:hypothetical protein
MQPANTGASHALIDRLRITNVQLIFSMSLAQIVGRVLREPFGIALSLWSEPGRV